GPSSSTHANPSRSNTHSQPSRPPTVNRTPSPKYKPIPAPFLRVGSFATAASNDRCSAGSFAPLYLAPGVYVKSSGILRSSSVYLHSTQVLACSRISHGTSL